MKAQKLNQRQARWAFYLSRFKFTLKHVTKTKTEKADKLSKRPDQKIRTENDNKNKNN